ncbi:MAG: efflux RND transporter periplasmic adaptor subunit [Verrucomicrobiae bacterium]|nr:efflux RND transporter periplasmic adaptor subunit [Verrucomicrobiae bacterium]NNJ43744.1 efflux RND transporter periplasmic adaptor subunit [Akkermansiaceae bacterium]
MKLIAQILLPISLVLLAMLAFKKLAASKKPRPARSVDEVVLQADMVTVAPADHRPPVRSYGTVKSYFESVITPQVSGRIIEVAPAFRVGSEVKKGTVLARLDEADYVAALAREKSNLSQAKRAWAEEKIRAKQAVEDWEASGRDKSTASDFVLRQPQLASAEAGIESAEAAVDKAEIDIQRTQIMAPYDALVLERTASEGNFASPQLSLGVLVATERVEIRLPLTAAQAMRVELPGAASREKTGRALEVTLTGSAQSTQKWYGELVRTEPAVDVQSQVTYVIVEVKTPYAEESRPLRIGTFVNASIPAKLITGAYKLPESALVNDRFVWALNADDQLCRLTAHRVHSDDGHVFLTLMTEGLKPPLRIVSRPLTNFKSGDLVEPQEK